MSRIILLILLFSLILTPFAGLAPLMLLGAIAIGFSIVESIIGLFVASPVFVTEERDTPNS
ncbi:MAG TPA: hypothetical protein IGS17_06495 [Oscillatoriales cyanobacterium M59_W2019_021]|nr:MAG: hypothetical protein D6728_02190 [Cyanobacteria bacterium J055]HIK31566.1 hypothetical protein [Oscillatoriales cyanobacterium M4454_W2019_049]HIK50562.1 hypothetical protein [Oscillatoriales cyanobacterium M59_W2019_021]